MLIREFDEPSIGMDILRESGLSYEDLKKAKVAEYDLQVIREEIK
jgi:hypothetical protein